MKNEITEKGLELIAGHLESRVGEFPQVEAESYLYSLPENYSMYDVQTLAERIAGRMALVGYTPVIQLEHLPYDVGGLINLHDSKIVYIKIDKTRFEQHTYRPIELVAVIAHEMAHKLLWTRGFRDTSKKIEFMTDACAVYAGFGFYLYEAAEMVVGQHNNGTMSFKQLRKVGYLERWQIAYLRNRFFDANLVVEPEAEQNQSGTKFGTTEIGLVLILLAALLLGVIFLR